MPRCEVSRKVKVPLLATGVVVREANAWVKLGVASIRTVVNGTAMPLIAKSPVEGSTITDVIDTLGVTRTIFARQTNANRARHSTLHLNTIGALLRGLVLRHDFIDAAGANVAKVQLPVGIFAER